MIVVYYGGALGNKMFEYACAYVIKREYVNHYVKFFDTLKNVVWYESVPLDEVFQITMDVDEISNYEFYKITGMVAPPRFMKFLPVNKRKLTEFWYVIDRIINKKSESRKNGRIIRRSFSYIPFPPFKSNYDYFLKGHFANTRYFEKYKDDILREFTFKQALSLDIVTEIQNCNSVSVHVRRGDHVIASALDKYAYNCALCNKDYFIEAMRIMTNKYPDAVFYFFSDDKEYVVQNYGFVKNYKLVETDVDYKDMQIMSLCKHNIIANSTFGYWAAFLNRNEGKTVIAPKYYEYRNGRPIEFVYPDDWITLEV